MTLAQIGFFILSLITVAGALAAVTLRNLTHAVLSLVLFFFGIAGLFFMLRADFIGVIQILVYVGAVAVLIIFAIVLTRQPGGVEDFRHVGGKWWVAFGWMMAMSVGGLLIGLIAGSSEVHIGAQKRPTGSVEEVGRALMTNYVLTFELISILLTAALIGAVVIAMDEIQKRVKKQ